MEMGLGLGFRSLGLVSGKSCRKIIPRVFTVRAAKSLDRNGPKAIKEKLHHTQAGN